MGIEKAVQTIEAADVVIGVVDGVDADESMEFAPDIVVINKSDLLEAAALKTVIEKVSVRFPKTECLTTSATTGAGTEELLAAIAKVLCPELPPPGLAYPVTQAQVDWLSEILES